MKLNLIITENSRGTLFNWMSVNFDISNLSGFGATNADSTE